MKIQFSYFLWPLVLMACQSATWRRPSNEAQSAQFGFDYSLKKRCIKSSNVALGNYYQDISDCNEDSSKHWTIAIETENKGAHCGPQDQTFPINQQGSPVSLSWLKESNAASNYAVELKTDFSNANNPCGAPSFSWYAFMDHAFQGGGPLAPAGHSWSSVSVNFKDLAPGGSGATRLMMGWQGQWSFFTGNKNPDGTSEQKKASFLVEMNIYLDPRWGKMKGADPDVVTYNPATKYPFYYVALDGSKYHTTYSVQKNTDTNISIHWTEIIQNLIDRKLFPPPIGGFVGIVSEASFIATEVRNDKVGVGGPVTDLHFWDYRQAGPGK